VFANFGRIAEHNRLYLAIIIQVAVKLSSRMLVFKHHWTKSSTNTTLARSSTFSLTVITPGRALTWLVSCQALGKFAC